MTSFNGSSLFNNGEWHHVAAAVDVSAKTVSLYIDGSSVSSTPAVQNASSIKNGTADFKVAGNNDCKIYEVRVWNTLKTGAEIAANYTKNCRGDEKNLVGLWQYRNNCLDETNNNNDLTPANSPTYSIDDPIATEIKTILGLSKSSVKTVNGLAIASVKNWNGLV